MESGFNEWDEVAAGSDEAFRPLTASQLRHLIRRQTDSLVVGALDSAGQVALYTLSDPRDVADTRYVGQTRSPRARFLQHLAHARLWLPDDLPWWIASPELLPLYSWIRTLHREGYRLPVMRVTGWTESVGEGRLAERWMIRDELKAGRQLFNVETEIRQRKRDRASGPS